MGKEGGLDARKSVLRRGGVEVADGKILVVVVGGGDVRGEEGEQWSKCSNSSKEEWGTPSELIGMEMVGLGIVRMGVGMMMEVEVKGGMKVLLLRRVREALLSGDC